MELATQRLQAQGGRMTWPRRLILEALECLSCHPTAEELFEVVRQRDPTINLSTVYRTLRWLETEGLVSTRRFEDRSRQDRFDPAHPTEHFHFICRNCKEVFEFDSSLIRQAQAQFAQESGAMVESVSVVFYGLCARCRRLEKGLEEA